MSKYQQTKADLRRHLHEHLGFLRSSAASFDAGVLGEAKRLAATTRVLLHDTKQSKSLLGQLGVKGSLRYLDTAYDYNPKNLLGHHGLVGMQLGPAGATYWAPLGTRKPELPSKFVSFPDWWNKLVIVDRHRARFVRRDLVLALANMDGGAHVDPALDEAYALLTRANSIGWQAFDNKGTHALADVELYSVRQIAHELIESITRQYQHGENGA
jgi:hypothetical protein